MSGSSYSVTGAPPSCLGPISLLSLGDPTINAATALNGHPVSPICMGFQGLLSWETNLQSTATGEPTGPSRHGSRSQAILLAFLPDGLAISILATVGTSTSWNLETSGTGTSGGPSSHRCRLCAAYVTDNGTVRAVSLSWPLSPRSEPWSSSTFWTRPLPGSTSPPFPCK